MSGHKMRVLLLAALSTGQTALECLAQYKEDFAVTFVTHANEGASDYVPLLDKAIELEFSAYRYTDGIAWVYRPRSAYPPLRADNLTSLAQWVQPDIGLVLGWSSLLPADLLAVPKHGWLGHHESMLPKRRGRAPIVWPIIHDAPSSGLSFFWLTEGVDDGDIFCQAPFPIGPRDTSADLLAKANAVTRDLLLNDVLSNLKAGHLKRTPQDHSQATYCPRRTPDQGAIDFRQSPAEIDRIVRALSRPYPGAFCWHRLRKCYLWQARPVTPHEHHPDLVYQRAGTVVWVSDDGARQWVVCGGGLLEIYLPAGRMKVGDRFDGTQYYER